MVRRIDWQSHGYVRRGVRNKKDETSKEGKTRRKEGLCKRRDRGKLSEESDI
jgi:hypothetical protein